MPIIPQNLIYEIQRLLGTEDVICEQEVPVDIAFLILVCSQLEHYKMELDKEQVYFLKFCLGKFLAILHRVKQNITIQGAAHNAFKSLVSTALKKRHTSEIFDYEWSAKYFKFKLFSYKTFNSLSASNFSYFSPIEIKFLCLILQKNFIDIPTSDLKGNSFNFEKGILL